MPRLPMAATIAYVIAATSEVLVIKGLQLLMDPSYKPLPWLSSFFLNAYWPLGIVWAVHRSTAAGKDYESLRRARSTREFAGIPARSWSLWHQLSVTQGMAFGMLGTAKTALKVYGLLNVPATYFLILRATSPLWTMVFSMAMAVSPKDRKLNWGLVGAAALQVLAASCLVPLQVDDDDDDGDTTMDPDERFSLAGVLLVLASSMASAFNDSLVQRVKARASPPMAEWSADARREWKKMWKSVQTAQKQTISIWAAAPATVAFLLLFFVGPEREFESTQASPHTTTQFIILLICGTALAGAKMVDRLSKYTITQEGSAFQFQMIEAVRNKADLWLAVVIFGEPASAWMVAAFAISVVGAVAEQAATSQEVRDRLRGCLLPCGLQPTKAGRARQEAAKIAAAGPQALDEMSMATPLTGAVDDLEEQPLIAPTSP